MTRVNAQSLQSRLPELLDGVEQSQQIVLARHGEPVAALVADARRASRARAAFFGSMKGQIDMSRFDEADEEIARDFGMLD